MPIVVPRYATELARRMVGDRGVGGWARRVLTTDYFPATGRVVKQLAWNPAGAMLLAAAAALLCGLFLSPHAFVLLAALLAVLGIGVLAPWVALRGLVARVGFDRPRCREGQLVEVTLTLTRASRWVAPALAVRGGFAPPPGPDTPPPVVAAVPAVPGRTAVAVRWTFTPPRRGRYPLAAPAARVVTGYPFGIREAGRAVEVAGPLVVWPAAFPVGAPPDEPGDARPEGAASRSKVGQGGDVLGARPYRRGDSPRRIHWGQSARHDRLIVCELQSNARPRAQVVLDTDPAAHAGRGADSSREWAVRVAASLVEGWLSQGAEVEAVIDGRLYPTAAGAAHLRKLLDALAVLPDDRGPPLAEVLASAPCRAFDGGVRVVVTTDRGMAALGAKAAGAARFFVLEAAGFGGEPGPPPPARPWVTAADPGAVRHALRHGWKEAARVS